MSGQRHTVLLYIAIMKCVATAKVVHQSSHVTAACSCMHPFDLWRYMGVVPPGNPPPLPRSPLSCPNHIPNHPNQSNLWQLTSQWQYVVAGFMSNRGRQNVASYLVLDMGVDWRLGADWFESVLQDYDVCSNWGNWVSAAGFTGGRINHFNITKQSKVSCLLG